MSYNENGKLIAKPPALPGTWAPDALFSGIAALARDVPEKFCTHLCIVPFLRLLDEGLKMKKIDVKGVVPPSIMVIITITAIFAAIGCKPAARGNSKKASVNITIPVSDKDKYRVTLPEYLREIVKENRKKMYPSPKPDIIDIVRGYQPSGLDAKTDAAIADFIKQSKEKDAAPPESMSHGEIKGELDRLFDYLKYGYAAYQYFGGDEVFGAAKILMLKKLSLMADPVNVSSYVNDLLIPCLDAVLADNHFRVGEQRLGIRSHLYLNDDFIVQKTISGYTTEMNGQIYQVLRAGPKRFEGLLPTLTRKGELAYVLGLNRTSKVKPEYVSMDIRLKDIRTQEIIEKNIRLFPVSGQYRDRLSNEFYAIKEVDGISVLENRRLYLQDESDLTIAGFIDSALTLRDKPVLIIDLRDNEGGMADYASDWVEMYSGVKPPWAMFVSARLYSRTANEINPWAKALSPPEWGVWKSDAPIVIPNDNLVIVLIDDTVRSSGEFFAGFLRLLDNVLFVGVNTFGCLTTGNIGSVVLPISKQKISLGADLYIRPDLSQFEGVGVKPDLWVPPGESLDRVIRFVIQFLNRFSFEKQHAASK